MASTLEETKQMKDNKKDSLCTWSKIHHEFFVPPWEEEASLYSKKVIVNSRHLAHHNECLS